MRKRLIFVEFQALILKEDVEQTKKLEKGKAEVEEITK